MLKVSADQGCLFRLLPRLAGHFLHLKGILSPVLLMPQGTLYIK